MNRLNEVAFRLFAKSNFQNGGDSLRGIEANRQVCPTILEITFGKHHSQRLSHVIVETDADGK